MKLIKIFIMSFEFFLLTLFNSLQTVKYSLTSYLWLLISSHLITSVPLRDSRHRALQSHDLSAQTWKTIHTRHTFSHSNKANMKWWLWRPDDIRDFVGLKFPDIRLTDEEKPRKNPIQETSSDRGSNPGPLRERHACYRLFHSGGLVTHTLW